MIESKLKEIADSDIISNSSVINDDPNENNNNLRLKNSTTGQNIISKSLKLSENIDSTKKSENSRNSEHMQPSNSNFLKNNFSKYEISPRVKNTYLSPIKNSTNNYSPRMVHDIESPSLEQTPNKNTSKGVEFTDGQICNIKSQNFDRNPNFDYKRACNISTPDNNFFKKNNYIEYSNKHLKFNYHGEKNFSGPIDDKFIDYGGETETMEESEESRTEIPFHEENTKESVFQQFDEICQDSNHSKKPLIYVNYSYSRFIGINLELKKKSETNITNFFSKKCYNSKLSNKVSEIFFACFFFKLKTKKI